MDAYSEIVKKIIAEQEHVIGPLALEQAGKVKGLTVDWPKKEVKFQGDKKEILGNLVKQYEALFGQASVQVCKDAARSIVKTLPPENVPSLIL